MKKIANFVFRMCLYVVLIYCVLSALVYFLPDLFFFHPNLKSPNIENARKNGYPAETIEYKSKDGTLLYAWHTKPVDNDNGKMIVFMHGNAGNLDNFYMKVAPFHRYGYATFMPEYRGFGGIKGEMNSKNLVEDVMAGIKEINQLGYKNEDIIIYGFSMGSHMATRTVYNLKDEGRFNALVLEVPFNRIPDVAKEISIVPLPFEMLIGDKFDNVSIIPEIDTRLLIMAAKEDKIIPYNLAKDLYSHAAEPKNMIIYENAGHNDLYDLENFVSIKRWLEVE